MCFHCYAGMCGPKPDLDPDDQITREDQVAWATITDEMRSLVEAIRAFYELPFCSTGGPLHCELDDANVESLTRSETDIRALAIPYSSGWERIEFAPETGDRAVDIYRRLQLLTVPERATVLALWNGIKVEA